MRVFDTLGQQVALEDGGGDDPQLSFQAAASGVYFVGVSSAGDDAYDPTAANSGQNGSATGLYTLNLLRTLGVSPQPELTVASFHLGTNTASWGDPVVATFTVQNRGGAAAGPFSLVVQLSDTNRFNDAQTLLVPVNTSLSFDGLDAGGQRTLQVPVTLPGSPGSAPAGLPEPGTVFLGLANDPTDGGTPVNADGPVHGDGWETLNIVTRQTATGTNDTRSSMTLFP